MPKSRRSQYIVGAPRAGQRRGGEVYIVDPFPLDTATTRQQRVGVLDTVSGRQLGEYFGAAVVAADLDGDGLQDLVVGSPLATHQEVRQKRDTGKYVKVSGVTKISAFEYLNTLFSNAAVGFSKFCNQI